MDANGEVNGCASVISHTGATLEDQSSYLVMQRHESGRPEDLKLKINKK